MYTPIINEVLFNLDFERNGEKIPERKYKNREEIKLIPFKYIFIAFFENKFFSDINLRPVYKEIRS